MALAVVFALFNLVLVIWGVTKQDLAALLGGYSASEGPFLIGLGILVLSVLLFFYRRAVEDRAKITLRDPDVPTMPNAVQIGTPSGRGEGLNATGYDGRKRGGQPAPLFWT